MKKSQTLAALALAFALGLGVVAPVANTYAIKASDYTTEQRNEIDSLYNYASVLANSTKNLGAYEFVYNKIEDVSTKLQEKAAAQLKIYNEDVAVSTSTLNVAVRDALLYTNLAFDGENLNKTDAATQEQATPVAIAQLTTKSDLKSAYDALKTLSSQVDKNYEVLTKNYDTNKTAVLNLVNAYGAINTAINGSADGTTKGAIKTIEDAFATPAAAGTTFITNYKAIDAEGWEALTTSKAWTDAAANANTASAEQWGLIINAAKALPKYSLVAPVINAKVNYNKVADSDPTVVDYAKAKAYTEAYINAIMAFRGEAADPTNPEVSASVRTLTSGDVTVVAYLPNNVELVVKNESTNVFGDKAHKAYDISFTQNGAPYTFSGTAVVTIKTGSLDASKTSAYYVEGNNSSALTTVRNADSVSFTATHFSVYAIVEDGKTQVVDGIGGTDDDPSAPGTGIVSSAEGNAATTVSIVAGLATALTALGAGVVAYRSARRSNK